MTANVGSLLKTAAQAASNAAKAQQAAKDTAAQIAARRGSADRTAPPSAQGEKSGNT